MEIGVYQAKAPLPELLARVAGGKQVRITRHGSPIARLVPVEPERQHDVQVIEALKRFAKGRKGGPYGA